MARRHITIPVAAVALALASPPALAQAGSASPPPAAAKAAAPPSAPASREPESRASRILGMDVVNPAGEKVGDVEDIVLDRHGSVAWAIVSTGAFLGVGSRLHAVPWRSLQPDTRADRFVLDIDRDRLGRAPGFDANDMPDLTDRQWSAENRRHFPAVATRPRPVASAAGSGARPQ